MLANTSVVLNATNTFLNNTFSQPVLDCYSNCEQHAQVAEILLIWKFRSISESIGSGGAIILHSSSLIIYSEYSIFANNFAQKSGGAIAAHDGNITILGSTLFVRNIAYGYNGGAVSLNIGTLILQGNILFVNNTAPSQRGGALSIIVYGAVNISFNKEWPRKSYSSTTTNFCWNVITNGKSVDSNYHINIAADYGHSVFDSFYSKNLSLVGMVKFYGNVAAKEGGAISMWFYSRISIAMNTSCENNMAYNGGAMFFAGTSGLTLSPVANVLNHAESKRGALYFEDSQCSIFVPECFFFQ